MNIKKLIPTGLFLSGLLASSLASAGLNTGQIIVKFQPAAGGAPVAMTPDKLNELSQSTNTSIGHVRSMSGDAEVLSIPSSLSNSDLRNLIQNLNQRDDIEYADIDGVSTSTAVVDDPDFDKQWYLFPHGPTSGSTNENFGSIGAEVAWDTATGAGIVVAVLDTGITAHVDLLPVTRVIAGEDFVENFSFAADGNGRDDDATDPGDGLTAEEIENDTILFGCTAGDSSWHGTSVSGVIGATANNTIGVAGIAYDATILNGRVLGKCGGHTSDIVDGMRWAAGLAVTGTTPPAQKADIINLSLGGIRGCSIAEQAAVDEIIATGTVIVAAAGNSSLDASSSAPANCTSVISVSSITRRGARAGYTNFGSDIDISAPGGNLIAESDGIYTTSNDGTTTIGADSYASIQGTSFSAPVVSGVIALMLEANGGSGSLTPTQIYGTLTATSKAFPSGTSDGATDCNTSNCGSGIVNATDAIAAILAATITDTPFPTRSAAASRSSLDTLNDALNNDLFVENKGASAMSFFYLFAASLLLVAFRRKA